MPISFVGSRSAKIAGSDTLLSFSLLADETGATPTLQQGDLVVITAVYRTQTATGPWDRTSAGYTAAFANISQGGSGNQVVSLKVSYKFMGATPDSSVTVPAADTTGDGAAAIHVFRGVDGTTPLDVAAATAIGTGANSPDAPAITPATAGAWIYAGGGFAGGSAAMTAPAGMASAANDFATISNTQAVVGADFYSGWTTGAYDPAAFGGAPASTGAWAAATLALRPISTGTASFSNSSAAFNFSEVSAAFCARGIIAAEAMAFAELAAAARLRGLVASSALSGSATALIQRARRLIGQAGAAWLETARIARKAGLAAIVAAAFGQSAGLIRARAISGAGAFLFSATATVNRPPAILGASSVSLALSSQAQLARKRGVSGAGAFQLAALAALATPFTAHGLALVLETPRPIRGDVRTTLKF